MKWMTKQIPFPKPEVTTAILPSSGKGKATRHVYLETRQCVVDKELAYEFIFKCLDTGAERRWGLVDRFEFENEGN